MSQGETPDTHSSNGYYESFVLSILVLKVEVHVNQCVTLKGLVTEVWILYHYYFMYT